MGITSDSALSAKECSEKAPSLERIVAAMKAHVLQLIEIGQVPSEIASFTQLHDYCDANCLGGLGFKARVVSASAT